MNSLQLSFANRIYSTALGLGINNLVASFIVSQSAHETNGWTSDLFKRANNGFGMTKPSVRKSSYIIGDAGKQPDGLGHYAVYANIENSTKDLIAWFAYNKISMNNINNIEQYANILKTKGYYGDSLTNYLNNIKAWFLKVYGNLKNTNSSSIVILLIISVTIFLILKS